MANFIEFWEMELAFAFPDMLSGVHAFLVQQTLLLTVIFHQEFQLRRLIAKSPQLCQPGCF